jgi:hypothetical protein
MLHQFCPVVAKEFGVNVAIFLQNLAFWTQTNLANEKHIYDGHCWTYNSVEAFTEIFPYFTRKQIRTILDNALKNNLIIKGNYNKVKYDHTGWYALTPKSYLYFTQLVNAKNINLLEEAFKAICPFGQIELSKRANRNVQKGQPIPDGNPDEKPLKESITFSNTKEIKKSISNLDGKSLTALQDINSLNLPNEFLQQLIEVRKANKGSVNKAAMEAVYQELIKLKEAGLDLNECLNMYANCGWKGFVAEWFINSKAKNKQSNHLDHDSMAWAEGFKNNPLYDFGD